MPEFQSQVSQFIGGHGSVSAAAVMEGWLERASRLNLTPKALKQEFARYIAEVQVYAALEKIKQDRGEHNVNFAVNYAVTKDGVYHLEFRDGRYQLGKRLEDLFRGSLNAEMKAQIEIANKIARGEVYGGAVFSAREAQGGNGSAYDEIFDWRRGGNIDGFEVITMTGSIISNKTEALLEWARRGGEGISFTFSSESQPKIGEATFSEAFIEELIQKQTKANLDNPNLSFNRLGDAINNLLETKNLVSELRHGDDNPYTLDKLTEAQRAILEDKFDQFRLNMQNQRIEPNYAITELRRGLDPEPVRASRGIETPLISSAMPLVPPSSFFTSQAKVVPMTSTQALEPKVFAVRSTKMHSISDRIEAHNHTRDTPRQFQLKLSAPKQRESSERESRIEQPRKSPLEPKVFAVRSTKMQNFSDRIDPNKKYTRDTQRQFQFELSSLRQRESLQRESRIEQPRKSSLKLHQARSGDKKPFREVDYSRIVKPNRQSVGLEIHSNRLNPRVPYRRTQSGLDARTSNLRFSRSFLSSRGLQHNRVVRQSTKTISGSSAVRVVSPRTLANRPSGQLAMVKNSVPTKKTYVLNLRLVRSVTNEIPRAMPLKLFDRLNFYILATNLKNLIKANPLSIRAREILRQALEIKGIRKLVSILKLAKVKSLVLAQKEKKALNLKINPKLVERRTLAKNIFDFRVLLRRVNLLSGRELRVDQVVRSPLVRKVLERMLEMLRISRKSEAFKRVKEEIKIALPGKSNLFIRRELLLLLNLLAKKGVIEELLSSDEDWLLSLLEKRSQLNKRDMRTRKREVRAKLKKFMDKRKKVNLRYIAENKIAIASKRASKIKIQKPIDQESRLVLVTEQSFLTDGKNAV